MQTARRARGAGLTKRERAILALAGRGLTNQEVADELEISVRTVKCLLHRACVKLGARNRDRAVIQGLRSREIGIHEIFSVDELAELVASAPPETLALIAQRAEHYYQNARRLQEQERVPVASAAGVS